MTFTGLSINITTHAHTRERKRERVYERERKIERARASERETEREEESWRVRKREPPPAPPPKSVTPPYRRTLADCGIPDEDFPIMEEGSIGGNMWDELEANGGSLLVISALHASQALASLL
jgi:hypothetical protein